jgi:hypothetical protein
MGLFLSTKVTKEHEELGSICNHEGAPGATKEFIHESPRISTNGFDFATEETRMSTDGGQGRGAGAAKWV